MGNSLLPLILICDNIKDPGMLGTLLRSAVAACCRTVLITKGNCFTIICTCISAYLLYNGYADDAFISLKWQCLKRAV